jgi:hypothetical protein
MTLNKKSTMVYNFTEEEREILEKASKILDTWENNVIKQYDNGNNYIEDLTSSCGFPSCAVEEILSNEDLEINMCEYT